MGLTAPRRDLLMAGMDITDDLLNAVRLIMKARDEETGQPVSESLLQDDDRGDDARNAVGCEYCANLHDIPRGARHGCRLSG